MDPALIVEVDQVSKRFDGFQAVEGVTLAVRRREFLSLLGPSGCGKSTILRMIAGFESPDSGAIVVEGRSMADVPAHKRPVNMVFQHYALFPHLTVFENVAFGLRRRKVPNDEIRRQVSRYLEMVGLVAQAERYPQQLSGGQQQRVALARALVNQPSVLLLDEPLGALDLKLRKRMQVELKDLQRELGISFIYVTHDQEEALSLSDRIAVMNEGRILQAGTGREIYEHPRSQFVANFIGEANVLTCRVEEPGNPASVSVGGQFVLVESDQAGSLRWGESILLAVRPEHIRLLPDKSETDHAIACTIVEQVFQGNSFLVYLRAGQDVPLMARGTDRGLFDRLRPGQTIYAGWDLKDGAILAE